jgi:L-amino acid N-acyltransferase YncA
MNHYTSIRLIKPQDAQAALDIYAYYVINTSITFETVIPSLDQTELIPKQPKSILEISGSAELKEILGE